jgi:L-ascorbate metabolism protein UlaG (beta-lactamase superfamily)
VFSRRIGPRIGRRTYGVSRFTPRADRTHEPAPTSISCCISHAHFDHLDRPSLDRLASAHTRVITAPKTGDLIPEGFGGRRRDRAGRVTGRRTACASPPCEPDHWGSRFALDRWRGCNAYLLESDEGRYFFAGDTALTRNFEHE